MFLSWTGRPHILLGIIGVLVVCILAVSVARHGAQEIVELMFGGDKWSGH
jgi:hypothetical protein